MASNKRVSNPSILVNNLPIAIVPNSFSFTEGLGEQKSEPQSAGGRTAVTVYSEDVESRISEVKFSLANTTDNIDLARRWKTNYNDNVIIATSDGWSRTFTQASLNSNYEIGLGADTNIDLEWSSNPAV